MHNNLVLCTKRTRTNNAAVAGSSDITTGTLLDMQGFDSVIWTACFGTLTGTQITSLKVQGGNASDGSDLADLVGATAGPMADGDSNKMLTIEVTKPMNVRYLKLIIKRGTANAVLDSVVATQYSARVQPTSDDATTSSAATLAISPQATSTSLTQTTTTYTGSTTKISSTARTAS